MNIPIKLEPDEANLRKRIEAELKKIGEAQAIGNTSVSLVAEMGATAHQLHMALKKRNLEPKHRDKVIQNRGKRPDDKEFYLHVHAVEDLLAFLDNPETNKDPVDTTIGGEFRFRVWVNSRGGEDTYSIKRTRDGWEITHMSIGGPCDKKGCPFLFENFRQDSILYPIGIENYFERLWNRAAEKGLPFQKVQEALQELADWVNATQKSAPSGDEWEGIG